MGTPPSAIRPPLPLLLLLTLPTLLPLCSPDEVHSVPQTPPRVINATNDSLTFVVDIQCPPKCDVSSVWWQIKTWVTKSWSLSEPATTTHTFTGLVPGVLYDVRTIFQRSRRPPQDIDTGVPVAKAYTCSNKVAQPWGLSQTDINETHVEVSWEMPRSACASTRIVLQMAPYDQNSVAAACPPPFLLDPQPHITCRPQPRQQDQCEAIIDGVTPNTKQYIGVYAIDWKGSCSERLWTFTRAATENPLGDVQIALIASLVLAAILLAALIPLLHKFRKRLAGRGAPGQRFSFSRMKPNAAASAALAVAQAPLEIDRDGYLVSDPQTRSMGPPLEQQQS